MLLKTNIIPKNVADACVTIFMLGIIPVVYYFELFVVLPTFYNPWSGWFLFHFIAGTFIMFNVCSNFVAIIMCDTSIKGRILPVNLGQNCRFCAVCECITPPRSWHCNVCNICILKRDHHCMFTSCCIGYFNHRYFIVFVFYIFLASLYASYYNLLFVIEFVEFWSWETLFKVVFPLATLFLDFSRGQMFIFLAVIVLIGCLFTGVLLYFHVNLMLKGTVTYERNKKLSEYNLGPKRNIIAVLGERWYLVWVSPFLDSTLPNDGINWDTRQSEKAK